MDRPAIQYGGAGTTGATTTFPFMITWTATKPGASFANRPFSKISFNQISSVDDIMEQIESFWTAVFSSTVLYPNYTTNFYETQDKKIIVCALISD
jgi:hypothetical protein